MTALTFHYRHTVPIRRQNGVDSEHSHSEVQDTETTVVVPADTPEYREMAQTYVNNYAGNHRDPAYQQSHRFVEARQVSSIISITRRLDS